MEKVAQWIDQLVDSSHIGILVVDKERNNLFVNDQLCEMFGYTQEELTSTTAEILHVNHNTFLHFADIAFEAVLKGRPLGLDYQFKRKDSSLFWIHIAGDPIKSKEEVLWTLVDITQRIESQEKQKKLHFKSKQLSKIIEQTHDSVISTDLDGNILTWNKGSEELFGYTHEEAISQNVAFLYPPEKFDIFSQNIKTLMENGELFTDTEAITKDKRYITTSLSLSVLYNEDGHPSGMVGHSQDITEKIEAQKKLEESNYNLQIYLDAIDKIGIGLFVVNEDFSVRYMNNTLKGWFGDQTGKICYSSVAGLNDPCPYCKLHEVIHENKKVIYEPITDKGDSFEIVATSIKNSDGTVSKMEFIRDVTEQKKAQENLRQEKEKFNYLAHHDSLTGLPNRILFNDRLEKAIVSAKRSQKKIALLFIDLDHFKEINDSLGHNVGDAILKIVTLRLQKLLRNEDTLARLGGDEFTIILEDLDQPEDSSLIASKILQTLAEVLEFDTHKLYVSSSIGISIYPDDGVSTQNLLKFADSAMYKAKDEGRNNYQYYNAKMTEMAFERLVMEASMREALVNEEFVVYYQPQVNGVTNKLIGMEALVRWQHPAMGLVSPDKFIPLAESTGLIVQLDRLVMKSAIKQLVVWYKAGLNPGVLALNLAIKQLHQEDFSQMVENLLEETGCKPEWIELEVTETQIMTHPEEAIAQLNEINNLGIKIAIDDFGTGYSSLAYLKRLPIDKLKIDQTFIRDLPDDEEDSSITKAVIALAQSLNLRIIAEGVETQEQKEFLVSNGCQSIQGYFYSRPVPADEIQKILENGGGHINIKSKE